MTAIARIELDSHFHSRSATEFKIVIKSHEVIASCIHFSEKKKKAFGKKIFTPVNQQQRCCS